MQLSLIFLFFLLIIRNFKMNSTNIVNNSKDNEQTLSWFVWCFLREHECSYEQLIELEITDQCFAVSECRSADSSKKKSRNSESENVAQKYITKGFDFKGGNEYFLNNIYLLLTSYFSYCESSKACLASESSAERRAVFTSCLFFSLRFCRGWVF